MTVNPATSTPPAASARAMLLDAVRDASSARYDVLGELGPSARTLMAYLGRLRADGSLGVLLLERDPTAAIGEDRYGLSEVVELDDRVPTLGLTCDACHTPVATWAARCAVCGGDVAGMPDDPAAVARLAAGQYELLGVMRRPGGGAVHFGGAPTGLVALRLMPSGDPAAPYTLAVTPIDPTRAPVQPTPPAAPRTPDATGTTRRSRPNVTAPSVTTRVCAQCGVEYPGDQRFCPTDGSPLRAKTAGTGLVGEIVAERYHVVRQLGEGGMGQVYLAEQVKMRRLCALKVMRPALATDPDAVRRFGAEAENASRIAHPNVAAIYDFGETADGLVYLAMEFVDGEPLAAILARERTLAPGRTAALARQIADGLSAAHELGIVHRDLKPDNVMVVRAKDGTERVKVVDFGIAKAIADGRTQMTRTGFVLGTPAYMSPEQISGDKLDGRTDLYSLGCMLFEMLTGRPAFSGPSGEVVLHRRLTEPAPRPRSVNPDIPKALDALVTTALSRSADERYQSAVEMAAALAACAASAGGDAPSAAPSLGARFFGWGDPTPTSRATIVVAAGGSTTVERTLARPRARRLWPLLGAGAVAVIAAVVFFYPRPPAVRPSPSPVAAQPAPPPVAAQSSSPPVAIQPSPPTAPSSVAVTPPPTHTTMPKPSPKPPPKPSSTTPVVSQPSTPPVVASTPPVATPTPPPAASTPSPPPAAPPSSVAVTGADAAAETRHVTDVLGAYVAALGAKDIDRMKQLYPTMPSAMEKGFRGLTSSATDFSATPTDAPTATVHADAADGDFGYAMDYYLPAQGKGHAAFRYHATLSHDPDGWHIRSLTARR